MFQTTDQARALPDQRTPEKKTLFICLGIHLEEHLQILHHRLAATLRQISLIIVAPFRSPSEMKWKTHNTNVILKISLKKVKQCK